jgi:hypothetical protein
VPTKGLRTTPVAQRGLSENLFELIDDYQGAGVGRREPTAQSVTALLDIFARRPFLEGPTVGGASSKFPCSIINSITNGAARISLRPYLDNVPDLVGGPLAASSPRKRSAASSEHQTSVNQRGFTRTAVARDHQQSPIAEHVK